LYLLEKSNFLWYNVENTFERMLFMINVDFADIHLTKTELKLLKKAKPKRH